MRESTMSFFKEVFAKSTAPTEATDSIAAMYTNKKNGGKENRPEEELEDMAS